MDSMQVGKRASEDKKGQQLQGPAPEARRRKMYVGGPVQEGQPQRGHGKTGRPTYFIKRVEDVWHAARDLR